MPSKLALVPELHLVIVFKSAASFGSHRLNKKPRRASDSALEKCGTRQGKWCKFDFIGLKRWPEHPAASIYRVRPVCQSEITTFP